jgi:putative endonuclease
MIMFYVYVLENQIDKSLYVGYSADLKTRLKNHLEGKGARTTKIKKSWKLIYYESYLDKFDALGREKFLKGGSGRKYIKRQLAHYFALEI